MIIFHEGMPRSGKSYAAMRDTIIPALKAGRRVFARLNGLNHAQIAELVGITEERCRDLLIELREDQILDVYNHVENDALVVIDELQNFFPSSLRKLDPEMMRFVTEHGHRGLDILAMGQVLNDCNAIWRNRTARKIVFMKRSVFGSDDKYTYKVFNGSLDARGRVMFAEVTHGTEKYDKKIFGTYASHQPDTENTENHKDSRAVVWNNPVFKRWIPLFVLVLLVAIVYVVWLFRGGLAQSIVKSEGKSKSEAVAFDPATYRPPGAVDPVVPAARKDEVKPVQSTVTTTVSTVPTTPPDYVDDLCIKYRIRFQGVLQSKRFSMGMIEWRDVDNSVKEVLTFDQLSGFGWYVMVSPHGGVATIQKADRRYVVTSWPINDYMGRVPEATTERLKPTPALTPAVGTLPADSRPVQSESVTLSEPPKARSG